MTSPRFPTPSFVNVLRRRKQHINMLSMSASSPSIPAFYPTSAAAHTSTVELSVSCRKIRDADIFSKSDPMCILYIEEFGKENWVEVGRTEVLMNTLDPEFVTKFVMVYSFEEIQKLKFALYDIDYDTEDLRHQDFLGEMTCTLGEIIRRGSICKPIILDKEKGFPWWKHDDNDQEPVYRKHASYLLMGTMTVTAEELTACKEEITFHFRGWDLDKRNHFLVCSSSSPFLTFSKATRNGTFSVVHRTETIRDNTDPEWHSFTISAVTLCNGDYNRTIKVDCYDWHPNGSHKVIGNFFTTMQQLIRGRGFNTYRLKNRKKEAKNSKYVDSGLIQLLDIQVKEVFTFVDYIRSGTELFCTFAVDFTFSNGLPEYSSSLHYLDPATPNPYVQSLRAIGEIIQDYDSHKLFPVFGFGAKLSAEGNVSHKFCVNMNPYDPHCKGIEGIINAYYACLRKVHLHGPTHFAPIINHATQVAEATKDNMRYHILLIITDGIINDLPETKRAIIEASRLPISIIIVGVGNGTFSAMEVLNDPCSMSSCGGKNAVRHIIQFVSFRDFQEGLSNTNTYMMTQAKLARCVLAKIPQQFIAYMKMNQIVPKGSQVTK